MKITFQCFASTVIGLCTNPIGGKMPLYEYCCECGHRFEELHRMSEASDLQPCPKCGELAERIMSAWGRVLIAAYDTVVGHDGTILSRKQSTEEIPMLPEKVHGGRF